MLSACARPCSLLVCVEATEQVTKQLKALTQADFVWSSGLICFLYTCCQDAACEDQSKLRWPFQKASMYLSRLHKSLLADCKRGRTLIVLGDAEQRFTHECQVRCY